MRADQATWDRFYEALPERFAKAQAFHEALSDLRPIPRYLATILRVGQQSRDTIWVEGAWQGGRFLIWRPTSEADRYQIGVRIPLPEDAQWDAMHRPTEESPVSEVLRDP